MASLRHILDHHPLVALTASAATCVVATYAVTSFFTTERLSIIKEKHSLELKAVTDHENLEINKLKKQIRSISRGITNRKDRTFDVGSAMINETSSLLLSQEFARYENGVFAVDIPEQGKWTSEVLNELTYQLLSLDDECMKRMIEKLTTTPPPIELSKVYMWHQRDVNSVDIKIPELSPLAGQCEHIKVFSSIEATVIDKEWVGRNIRFSTATLPPEKIPKIISKDRAKPLIDPGSILSDPDVVTADVNMSKLLSGEFTGPILFKTLNDRMALIAVFPQIKMQVVTVEKSLNTLYLHLRTTLPLSTKVGEEQAPSIISWDEEVFLIGLGNKALYILVTLVHSDNFSDDYEWTQAWIGGLRVTTSIPR